MHPNPSFRGAAEETNLAYARARGFGLLTAAGPEGPLASHIPFVMNAAGDRVSAHIVRSNPFWRALREGPVDALMAVWGPDGYISPDWYGAKDQVPTWNYVAVHLRGTLSLAPEEGLRDHLADLSAHFEAALPKPPWTMDKMDEEALARLMRMIAPVEMTVDRVEGTWKLNQNKDAAARMGAADGVAASGVGIGLAELADLMRGAQ